MSKPKRISDVSLNDLIDHRWCYYHNDELGYDAFEHVISDTHPEFDPEAIELELAEFVFANGKQQLGVYDGSESFSVVIENETLTFWWGVMKPSDEDIENSTAFLKTYDLALPVQAVSKWTKHTKTINGLEYIEPSNGVVSLVI